MLTISLIPRPITLKKNFFLLNFQHIVEEYYKLDTRISVQNLFEIELSKKLINGQKNQKKMFITVPLFSFTYLNQILANYFL